MVLGEALNIVREEEQKAHRQYGAQRGRIVHEAFEQVIKTVDLLVNPPKIEMK
jgi:hypothetical protein